MASINTSKDLEIKTTIQKLIKEWYDLKHHSLNYPFIPGHTFVPVSSKSYNEEELMMLTEACLDFSISSGKYSKMLEVQLAKFLNIKNIILTNSGSSARLLAISALTSPILAERKLIKGDEIIIGSLSATTAINPIIQNDLIPVIVDIEEKTYNIDPIEIEKSISDKTRAIFINHLLGNPTNIEKIINIAQKQNLWVIDDCSYSLGSRYKDMYTGGDISILSFSQSRHITTGEGGAVITNNNVLRDIILSYRDQGINYCEENNTNESDYCHIGYNLKPTDIQAAIGLAQLRKLPYFIAARKRNFELLYDGLKQFQDKLILPTATENSYPSWYGFLIIVKNDAGFTRDEIAEYLNNYKIETGYLSSIEILKQSAYMNINCRIADETKNSDFVANNSFWLGVHPNITEDIIKFMTSKISEFIINSSAR